MYRTRHADTHGASFSPSPVLFHPPLQLPWIARLQQLLPQYLSAGVRLVGCCFGHQLLSQALGGRVGKNPSGRFVLGLERIHVDEAAARAVGLDFRAALEQATQDRQQQEGGQQEGGQQAEAAAFSADKQEQRERHEQGGQQQLEQRERRREQQGSGLDLRLLESHGDQVLELPPGAQLLAWSGERPAGDGVGWRQRRRRRLVGKY